ncbi:hypothetical protein PJ985_13345 [Streptomyces sp. ACA25]|uniref:hypothetical protein n=1 Tax=Streptomyces sp. ACA25 TaxID=3022596 RepID=UPI002307A036|nr:hypothetical protein [Streptomyces sp. ACA25]MDB1088553.1 hypothetical protein [Streptomyces sp. ACA25]
MAAEVAALAAAGASTLVSVMATDGWAALKARVAQLLGRGDGGAEAVEAELEQSSRELAAARQHGEEALVVDIETEWRMRFRRLIQEDPAARNALRELLAEEHSAQQGTTTTHNTVSGTVDGPVVQTGSIQGGLHFQ